MRIIRGGLYFGRRRHFKTASRVFRFKNAIFARRSDGEGDYPA